MSGPLGPSDVIAAATPFEEALRNVNERPYSGIPRTNFRLGHPRLIQYVAAHCYTREQGYITYSIYPYL